MFAPPAQQGARRSSEALEGSTFDVGAVMFLIALSGIFGYGIAWDQVPDMISNAMLGVTDQSHTS